jgi:hypothetical protein
MINLQEIGDKAAGEFGLSLLDDKQIWESETPPTAEEIKAVCFEVAEGNAKSAIARAVGKLAEPITQDIDVAIAEDGPLAGLDGVLAMYIQDAQFNDPDFMNMFVELKSWDAKIELVREKLRTVCLKYKFKPLTVAQLLAYVNSDPRLEGSAKAVSALDYEGASDVFVQNEMLPIPEALKRVKTVKPAPAPAVVDTSFFDDEPSIPAVGQVPVTFMRREAPASGPRLCALAAAAGIPDQDMASLLNVSKSFYSLIRSGKRPWNGMKPDRVEALKLELEARKEIIDELAAELEAGFVTKATPALSG